MHHAENNLEDDLSSTMMYRRDSLKDFLKYFGSFFFGIIVSLTNYHHIRKRLKMRNKVLKGEIFFVALCIGLMFVNLPAVLVVFIAPLLLTRFIMMIGNWPNILLWILMSRGIATKTVSPAPILHTIICVSMMDIILTIT